MIYVDHATCLKVRSCYFKNIKIDENLIYMTRSTFIFNKTIMSNISSQWDYLISSSYSIGEVNDFICQDCIDGTFYLKNSSFSLENSSFKQIFSKSNDVKLSAIYSLMNPAYFLVKNTSFFNLANNNNGPVIYILSIIFEFLLKLW